MGAGLMPARAEVGWFGMQCELYICPVPSSAVGEDSGWSRLNPAWAGQWEELSLSGAPC